MARSKRKSSAANEIAANLKPTHKEAVMARSKGSSSAANEIAAQEKPAHEENDMGRTLGSSPEASEIAPQELTQEEQQELVALLKASEEAKATLKAAKERAKELQSKALGERRARIEQLKEELRKEKELLEALGGPTKSIVAGKYKRQYGKAGNCGDAVANALAGVPLDVILEAAYERGLLVKSEHGHMNRGGQRMTLGNILRNKAKRTSKEVVIFKAGNAEVRGQL